MSLPNKILWISFLLLLSAKSFAQDLSNLRHKVIAFNSDTIRIDTLSIIPESEALETYSGNPISENYFTVNYSESLIILLSNKLTYDSLLTKGDSLKISYRVFPYNFNTIYYNKDYSRLLKTPTEPFNPFAYNYNIENTNSFKTEGLNKSGSISRGVMFGNNQDLSVNSNLNLNLSGKLNERFSVLAAITDNNIPIQPEGNTSQLQNFDQVYIQLYDDNTKITAGDFQLSKPNGYFMNFYKRAQGGSFVSTISLNEKDNNQKKMTTSLSAAVSKGKFSRSIIQGIEGNQGPYRLKGAENETYIIILSGTEKIYIDGRLMTRGQENDYVIDYNTSELTFTAKQLITKDRRIIAEFQYSDKNYARSLIVASNEFTDEKIKLRVNIYSEQDAKNQPLQQTIDSHERSLLSSIGDSVHLALFPSADSVAYNSNEVLYKLTDTTVNNILYDSVYVFSTNPDSAFYRLGFSFMGQNKGNYIQIQSSANGKVFRWIAPVNGIPQGTYEPVIVLATPKKRQMITLGGEYQITKNTKTLIELGYSNYDVNTFSTIDDPDNDAIAIKTGIENKKYFGTDNEFPFILTSWLNYEQINKNFTAIERFRSIEFERDWNLLNKKTINTQFISSAGVELTKSNFSKIEYELQTFNSKDEFKGIRNSINGFYKKRKYDLDFSGSYLNSEGFYEFTDFFRQKTKLSRTFKYIQIGVWEDQEINKKRKDVDSLNLTSYEYFEWEGFIASPDTNKTQFFLGYKQRIDKTPFNNQLEQSTFGESYNAKFGLLKNPNSQLTTNSTYRRLFITNAALTSLKPENTFLNRLEYSIKLFNGTINTNTFYEIGSGLELKKEFIYLEVPAGQGVYAYVGDLNYNGVKDLNEFEMSPFPDLAKYIKVYTPTNEYVKVYTNQFNQILNIYTERAWGNKKGIRKLLSQISGQVAYRVDRKTSREDFASSLNPFFEVSDTTLVAINSSLRSTVFLNRTHPVFGVDYSWNDNRNRSLLMNGIESRMNYYNLFRSRWNISNSITFNLTFSDGKKSNTSEFFSNRNYSIKYHDVEPKISFQKGTSFRVALLYKNGRKNNAVLFGGEKLLTNTFGSEIRYNVLAKGNFVLNINYILNTYNANELSLLSFEMLEGLQAGKNATWSLTYNRNLSNNTQLSVNYLGRKSENIRAIHSGGVQVRAFF